ncbi:CTP synthase [Anthonomus grandis grandis]|uniref:CTP synthase n=1 Tax=Anthonomus grandis grandis TaxID=2921223 RepID=UPI0021663E4E|nr:CTP synthase [Anthonomus grandis grandis]
MKYILVTGGVISGVGKGVISSSFGAILKCCGIEVTMIKIDPYINLDAGTFSPYEHGEVYVLDDGGEVDLDLGNYERFLNVTLHKENNITTGKIYQSVILKERHGDYLGKTVQVVPHITDAIQEWVERVAQKPVSESGRIPEVCIIELGGIVGDIESMAFVEAFRQFQFRVKRENFCVAHVSLVPQPRTTGESKTKPTQSSVRELRGLGLSPDIIVCRSERPIEDNVKAKISNFCHVAPQQIISVPDLNSVYEVPVFMENHGMAEYLSGRLDLGLTPLPPFRKYMTDWIGLGDRIRHLKYDVTVAIVGKYTRLEDSYTSITKALHHAGNKIGYKVNIKFIEASNLENTMLTDDPASYHTSWRELCLSDCVVVPGGFGKRGVEGKIEAVKWCRMNEKPFLGICLGFQAAVIEFARSKLGLEGANSTEVNEETKYPLVIDMPEHNQGNMGGTMRLGKRTTVFKSSAKYCKMRKLYGNKDKIEERHRHRYEVNPEYIEELEKHGMKFVGVDVEEKRMEILELEDHPYFVAVQYHPEYLSRPVIPSPPFMGLILAAKDRLKGYLARGCKLSPREPQSDYYDSEEEAVAWTVNNLTIKGETDDSSAYSSSSQL